MEDISYYNVSVKKRRKNLYYGSDFGAVKIPVLTHKSRAFSVVAIF
jgi:hypothetical protein